MDYPLEIKAAKVFIQAELIATRGKTGLWKVGESCVIADTSYASSGQMRDVHFENAVISHVYLNGSVRAECKDDSSAIFTPEGICNCMPGLVLLGKGD